NLIFSLSLHDALPIYRTSFGNTRKSAAAFTRVHSGVLYSAFLFFALLLTSCTGDTTRTPLGVGAAGKPSLRLSARYSSLSSASRSEEHTSELQSRGHL